MSDGNRLIDAIVIPTLALDAAGHVSFVNPAAERLLDWDKGTLLGQPLEEIVAPRFRAIHGARLYAWLKQRVKGNERSFRMPALRKDGVEIEVECAAGMADDGGMVLSLQRRIESFGFERIEDEATPGPGSRVSPLREQEQIYRLLFDHAPLGIWHFDKRGVITACNDQFAKVIGSSKRALIGLAQLTLKDSFIRECVAGALDGSHMHYEGDYRSMTAPKITPVRAHFAPIRGDNGQVTGGVGILEDITERKRAEDALRESNSTLRALFEASPLGMVQIDGDRIVRMWNPAAERMFGFSEGETLNRPFPIVPADRSAEFSTRLEGLFTGSMLLGLETHYQRKDGSRVEVSVSAARFLDGNGNPMGIIGVFDEVTERRRAQEERALLLEQEHAARQRAETAQQLLSLLAMASAKIAGSLDFDDTLARAAWVMRSSELAELSVVWLCDDGGELIPSAIAHADATVSERARTLLAADAGPAQTAARTGHAIASSDGDLRALAALGLHAAISVPLIVRGRTLGALTLAHGERAFELEDVWLAEELGRRAGVAIDNASLFRETEQALRGRDEFLSVASHELRTPMTSLRLSVQNLESMADEGTLATAPPAVLTRALATTVRQSRHMSRLVDELLDITRLHSGRFELQRMEGVDLAALARNSVAQLEREIALAGCTVTVDADPAAIGRWDGARLEQVVTNLLTNALKFGAGKPIAVRVRAGGESASLTVSDGGVGVAPEEQARIFERFERGGVSAKHYGGLGLGLYIARTIVEAHGGRISVASVAGEGAAFTVELPR